jgi:hypothetical protein
MKKTSERMNEKLLHSIEDDLLPKNEPENYGSSGSPGPPGDKVLLFVANFLPPIF